MLLLRSMNEFEKFETIPHAEMEDAVRLSELVLPTEAQPVIGADGSLHQSRIFNGYFDTGNEVIFTFVLRDKMDDGADILVASKASERDSDKMVTSVTYTLVLNNGRFLVERETDHANNIPAFNPDNIDIYEEIESDEIEFELGLMKPQNSDWDDFKELLANPTQKIEVEAKSKRFTRLLRKFRKNK